ncbi:MAG: 16S rRNA (adenine(1518)-N(6)/adenine(1519)-N(6))-dimethyltransferase RsmA [Bacteroidales bacterium]
MTQEIRTHRREPFARKRFGQHFLEPAWVQKVVEAVEPTPSDQVLEIGPGRGALTRVLAPRVARVLAIEIDRDLAAGLEERVPANVQVVTADFLEANLPTLLAGTAGPVRVVGNLPYNVSSPILFRLLAAADSGRVLSDATLMLQREVADRVAAAAGSRDYGVLGIMVQLHAQVRRLFALPPGAFRPAPKVHSAVVRLTFRPPMVPLSDPGLFAQVVRALFSQRRKTAANALRSFAEAKHCSAALALTRASIDPRRRPETLELPELATLTEVFASASPPDVL